MSARKNFLRRGKLVSVKRWWCDRSNTTGQMLGFGIRDRIVIGENDDRPHETMRQHQKPQARHISRQPRIRPILPPTTKVSPRGSAPPPPAPHHSARRISPALHHPTHRPPR